jgi:hypothetical protein
MQRRGSRSFSLQHFALPCLALCLVAGLALGLAINAFASDARNFAGSYRITEVTRQAGNVQLRLSLRVINYSGADVNNATILLKSSLPHPGSDLHSPPAELRNQRPAPPDPESAWERKQPAFQGVTLHFNEHKIVPPLEAVFTVPAREYEQWMKGARPNFVIRFQDAAGRTQQQAVELTNMP